MVAEPMSGSSAPRRALATASVRSGTQQARTAPARLETAEFQRSSASKPHDQLLTPLPISRDSNLLTGPDPRYPTDPGFFAFASSTAASHWSGFGPESGQMPGGTFGNWKSGSRDGTSSRAPADRGKRSGPRVVVEHLCWSRSAPAPCPPVPSVARVPGGCPGPSARTPSAVARGGGGRG